MRCKPCFAHHLTGSPFDCARRPWSRSFTREGTDTFQKMSFEVDERIHQLLWVNGEQSGYLLKTLKAANAPYGSVVGLTTNHQSSSRSRWRKPAADWAVATPPACWQRRHPIPRFSQRLPSFVLSRSLAVLRLFLEPAFAASAIGQFVPSLNNRNEAAPPTIANDMTSTLLTSPSRYKRSRTP